MFKHSLLRLFRTKRNPPIGGKRTIRVVKEAIESTASVTVGDYLVKRLIERGLRNIFTVPGDFNLNLLDAFVRHSKDISTIGCCNELNAAYAADGYARATKGLAAVVVTYM